MTKIKTVVGSSVLIPYTHRQLLGKVVREEDGRFVVNFKSTDGSIVQRSYKKTTPIALSAKAIRKHKERRSFKIDFKKIA